MIRRVGKPLAILFILALVISPLLAACAEPAPPPPAPPSPAPPSPAPAVRWIQVGSLTDYTGPCRTCGMVNDGSIAYWKYVNEELGGIKGPGGVVKVDFLWADTVSEPGKALEAYERWKTDPDFLVVQNLWTSIALAVREKCEVDHVIQHYWGMSSPVLWPPTEWTYGCSPLSEDVDCMWLEWVKDTWKEERPPKVAILVTEFGWGKVTADTVEKYAEVLGIDIAGREVCPSRPTDTTVQLTKLAAAEPDYILLAMTTDDSPVVLKDAYRLGLMKKGIQIVHDPRSPLGNLLHLCPDEVTDGLLALDIHIAQPESYPPELITPGMQKAIDVYHKYEPTPMLQKGHLFKGLVSAIVVGEAVRLALEEVSAEDLNAETLKEYGFDRIKDFSPWDMAGPVTYTAEDRRGFHYAMMEKVEMGKITRVIDWRECPFVTPAECISSKYCESGKWEDILK